MLVYVIGLTLHAGDMRNEAQYLLGDSLNTMCQDWLSGTVCEFFRRLRHTLEVPRMDRADHLNDDAAVHDTLAGCREATSQQLAVRIAIDKFTDELSTG